MRGRRELGFWVARRRGRRYIVLLGGLEHRLCGGRIERVGLTWFWVTQAWMKRGGLMCGRQYAVWSYHARVVKDVTVTATVTE